MIDVASIIELLDIVIIPVVLAVIALLWPDIHARYRRHAFENLISRELEEISPYVEGKDQEHKSWFAHQNRKFIHQKIFEDVTGNRDFILSLDPTLVYYVSQLWEARRKGNSSQWLYYLQKISKYASIHNYKNKREIQRAYNEWQALIEKLHEIQKLVQTKISLMTAETQMVQDG